MNKTVRIFSSPDELAGQFASDLAVLIKRSAIKEKPFTVALSGGSTPELLFSVLSDRYANIIPWEYVHLFWGDERCVPPDDPESNYGMTSKSLLEKIKIPASNIHRIKGEDEPLAEAVRYGGEISQFTENRSGMPQFDIIILGLGTDGHTASIFPGNIELFDSDTVCAVATHPLSGQRRITITGRVINNAEHVVFLVTGKNKAGIIEKIVRQGSSAIDFPASHIRPEYGILTWLLDRDAGELL